MRNRLSLPGVGSSAASFRRKLGAGAVDVFRVKGFVGGVIEAKVRSCGHTKIPLPVLDWEGDFMIKEYMISFARSAGEGALAPCTRPFGAMSMLPI